MSSAKTVSVALSILFIPLGASASTVTVADNCTVVDTDGNSHVYSGNYLGICALAAAKEQEVVSAYTLQNFSFGLFLQSLNGITPGETEFWSISLNGAEAAVGLSDLTLAQDDTLSFQLTNWSTNTSVGSPVSFQIALLASAPSAPASPSGGGGDFLKDRVFNVESAFDFLVAKQNADGSFDSPMLTDWAAIAFGTAVDDVCNDACPSAREKLRAFVASASASTSSATELERHIMALEALALDPHQAPGSPVAALVAKFDGTQMDDPSLVNDDIFAIFSLLNAGYTKDDPMVSSLLSFILSKQKSSGSWEESVDLTAAAIQTLALFPDNAEAADSMIRAKEYLRRNQDDSGIFGKSSFTLSWVLQAIAAFGETPQVWKKSGVTPLGYLGVLQQDDGGMEPMSVSEETRVWATAYAIPAAFGKPWDAILKDFPRPAPPPPPAPPSPVVEVEVPPIPEVRPSISTLAPSPEPIETTFLPQATSSENSSTTTPESTTSAQVAAAAQSTTEENGAWPWLAGLMFILGATFYFLRRA